MKIHAPLARPKNMSRFCFSAAWLILLETEVADIPGATSKPALCLEPKVTGGCNAMMSRYSYNTQIRLCKQFVYGGCEGNGNNFEKLEECMKTCSQEAGGWQKVNP
uniref:BPTI/Kunitz inhibitor domain-containing protein n=1 Tax=Bos mutus grunniens TaxID=30521 RepID=A0A8C0AE18_BOSMU